jgi:hypothetical protein
MRLIRGPKYQHARAASLLATLAAWLGLILGALHLSFLASMAIHQPQALAWGWAALAALGLLLMLLAMAALWRARLARGFLRHFGGLPPLPAEPEAGRELTLKGAQAAYEQGDIARAQRMLERWLEAHPGDQGAREWRLVCWAHSREMSGLVAGQLELDEPGSLRQRWAQRLPKRGPALHQLESPLALWAVMLPLLLCLSLAGAEAWHLSGKLGSQLNAALSKADFDFFSSEGFDRAESEHFIYRYHSQDQVFLNFARFHAEHALEADCAAFGMDPSQFTSPKTSLFLADSEGEFLARSPYTKSWEAGVTVPELHAIYMFLPDKGDQALQVKNILGHEIGHVLFSRLFPDLTRDTWLNEGLAMYLGTHYAHQGSAISQAYLPWVDQHYFQGLRQRHLPFSTFLSASPQRMGSLGDISTFYMQGFSIVVLLMDYLGSDGGPQRFMAFLRSYGRSKDMNQALAEAYGPRIKGMDDLQGIWLLFMT